MSTRGGVVPHPDVIMQENFWYDMNRIAGADKKIVEDTKPEPELAPGDVMGVDRAVQRYGVSYVEDRAYEDELDRLTLEARGAIADIHKSMRNTPGVAPAKRNAQPVDDVDESDRSTLEARDAIADIHKGIRKSMLNTPAKKEKFTPNRAHTYWDEKKYPIVTTTGLNMTPLFPQDAKVPAYDPSLMEELWGENAWNLSVNK
jgi:hypothetical protein